MKLQKMNQWTGSKKKLKGRGARNTIVPVSWKERLTKGLSHQEKSGKT